MVLSAIFNFFFPPTVQQAARTWFLSTNHGPMLTRVNPQGQHLLWDQDEASWMPHQFIRDVPGGTRLFETNSGTPALIGIASYWEGDCIVVNMGGDDRLVYAPVPACLPPGTRVSPDLQPSHDGERLELQRAETS